MIFSSYFFTAASVSKTGQDSNGQPFSTPTIQEIKRFYKDHSDLISSITNLTLNTLLLISKLTDHIPSIVPRMASTSLGFSGIICLNVMVRDWAKHFRDCRFAWRFANYGSLVLAAARVHVKATNILLLLSGSLNTLVALAGFTSLQQSVIRTTTPIALLALVGTISGEFIDYACKSTLLGRLDELSTNEGSKKKFEIAKHFLALASHPPFSKMDTRIAIDRLCQKEQQLAIEIVMQMEEWSLETLKQELSEEGLSQSDAGNCGAIFNKVRKALEECQKETREKISLITLGYISMALCKAYPYTLLQYSLNWGMSLLYTCQLASRKLNEGSRSS